MYIEANFHLFQSEFIALGRDNQFSYEGLRALFDYLEELEITSLTPIEIDVIELYCEFEEVEGDEQTFNERVVFDYLLIKKLPTSILVRKQ
jgi:hypothetical protein